MAFFGKHLLHIAKLPQKHGQIIRSYANIFPTWNTNGIDSGSENDVHRRRHQPHSKTSDADHSKNQTAKQKELYHMGEVLRSSDWRTVLYKLEDKSRYKCHADTLNLYELIALNAFEEGDFYLGWTTLNAIVEKRFNPYCDILIAYWKACSAIQTNFEENIERMFQFISAHNVLVSRSVIEHLNTELRKFGGSVTNTSVDSERACSVCSEQLQQVLSNTEFTELVTEFEDVLINPQLDQTEKFRLKQLVGKKKRFDVIIDALNVTRVDRILTYQNKYKQAQILKLLINDLLQSNYKICIVGRKYLNEWPDHIVQYIHRNATVHLTTSTNDDLVTMYATLTSGRQAIMITNDLFSDHRFKLSTRGQELFERWQRHHQHYFTYDDAKKSGKIHDPSILYRTAQSNGYWHIPYTIYPLMTIPFIHTSPVGWSCVKLKK